MFGPDNGHFKARCNSCRLTRLLAQPNTAIHTVSSVYQYTHYRC